MKKMRKTWIILTILIVMALVSTVGAIPITFDQDCSVSVKYLGTDAGYSNFFGWVEGTPPGTLHELGQGHVTVADSIFAIGPRFANENIILYIKNDYNDVFFSDPAEANPDGREHVQVVPIDPTAVLVTVGFEDLYGGGDNDYNDIFLQVSCEPIINPPPPVPEFPTMALPVALIVGMLGAVFIAPENQRTITFLFSIHAADTSIDCQGKAHS